MTNEEAKHKVKALFGKHGVAKYDSRFGYQVIKRNTNGMWDIKADGASWEDAFMRADAMLKEREK